jgi:hypothetical protein
MSSVGVVIPWYQRDPDPWRDRIFAHVRTWWETAFSWQVVVGTVTSDEGPWRKGLAVHRGISQLDTEIVVVADADVTCDGVDDAVDQIARLAAGWAIPHRLVCRLTSDATSLLLQDGRYPATPTRTGVTGPGYTEVYSGVSGGGMVVLPRRLLTDVPLDPRFCGWGQEDLAWSRALTMVSGHPWRGRSPLFHLWHEPQQRMSRGVGSQGSHRLWQRYQTASTLPVMLDLVEEARLELVEDGFGSECQEALSDPMVTI